MEIRRSNSADPIPIWASTLHRALLVGFLGCYTLVTYLLVRPLFETIGFDAGTTMKSMVVVALLTSLMIFLLPVADLPSIWFLHHRPARRRRRGRCPDCGYPLERIEVGTVCPECGSDGTLPEPWRPNRGTVRRFLLALLLALLAGSVVGEWFLLVDEARFRQEAAVRRYAVPSETYSRSRQWPNQHARMSYSPARGAVAEEVLQSIRIPRWRRSGE
jgi:hypothetical protein